MALVAEASGLMEPLKELVKVKKIPVWVCKNYYIIYIIFFYRNRNYYIHFLQNIKYFIIV